MLLNRYSTHENLRIPEDQLKTIPGENAEPLISETLINRGFISDGRPES